MNLPGQPLFSTGLVCSIHLTDLVLHIMPKSVAVTHRRASVTLVYALPFSIGLLAMGKVDDH
jgi:hypothetical protein